MSDDGGYDDFDVDEPDLEYEEDEEVSGDEDMLEGDEDVAMTFDQYETDVFGKTLTAVKRTVPILTKYERAKVIGLRAQQIARGAPLYIDRGYESDPIRLAEMELVAGKLPYVIRRRLPNEQFEDWKLNELTILDDGRYSRK